MANYNKVILAGNLTRDPEMRVTPGGASICKLGMAINRSYTRQDGTKVEETTFVDVDVFGKQAEVISRYMSKGRPILIEGRLKLDQWETQGGEKRSRMVVVCENFQFLGGRGDADGGGGGNYGDTSGGYERTSPPPRQQSAPPPASSGGSGGDMEDDDVPF